MKVARRDQKIGQPRFEVVKRSHLEVATACKTLSRCGWDEEEIANEICIPEQEVGAYLMLAGAPLRIRSRVSSGEISAAEVLMALYRMGPPGLDDFGCRQIDQQSAAVTLLKPESSGKQQLTNTSRLLQVLEVQGQKDADQLEALTGIRKAIIVSTLYTAMGRGQVKCTPKYEWLREAGLLKDDGKRPRGQIYSFLSYASRVDARTTACEKSDVQKRLDEMAELMFKPGLMQMVSMLDSVCKTRKVTLLGLH
jgi:hypothetical protein